MIEDGFEHFVGVAKEEITELLDEINYEKCYEVALKIYNSQRENKRLHVTGIGKNSYVAAYFASLMSSVGTPTYFLDGTEAVHGSSGQVAKEDLVICISNSGQTEELIKTMQTLRLNGAFLIGLTSNEKSSVSELSDIFIKVKMDEEGGPLNKAPRCSVIGQLLVLQAISVIIQSLNGQTLIQYKRFHPGGALGKSINESKERIICQ